MVVNNVGKLIFKTKVFVNFGLILRWAPHVRWAGTTLERVLLCEEMKFVYSHVEIHLEVNKKLSSKVPM